MSLLGLLFGDNESSSNSSSSTTQTTNNVNPFVAAGSQGVSVSSVNTGGGFVTNNVSNTTLDGEVAVRAMDNMLNMGQDGLLFGANAMQQSYKFADAQNSKAFALADNSMMFAADASNAAYAFSNATQRAANATTSAAMGSAQDSMFAALNYGSKQTSVALDSLSQSANMIKDSYADAKGRGALTDYMLMGAIAGAVLIAVYAIKNH